VTTNADPVLTGTAAALTTVTVYDLFNGTTTELGTTTAAASGAWSYDASNLANGQHQFFMTATDSYGVTSAASSQIALSLRPAA
jgi:VCBS repeat-containing protein